MSALTRIVRDDAHHALAATLLHAFPSISWRHHGIGVLQGYLVEHTEPEVRVHVWHPDLIKPGIEANGDVHDHRFDMVSHVLIGDVVHEEWHATAEPRGDFTATLLTHARAAADSKYHGPTTPTDERYAVETVRFVIPAGYRYSFPARAFHRSPVVDLAVTIVEKHQQRTDPARILHPASAPFVPAFGHDEDAALLVHVLECARAALGNLWKANRCG